MCHKPTNISLARANCNFALMGKGGEGPWWDLEGNKYLLNKMQSITLFVYLKVYHT